MMFNLFKCFVMIIIFYDRKIEINALLGLTPEDCTSIVNTTCASYRGCRYYVSTESDGLRSSLVNAIHPRKEVYQFKGIRFAVSPVGEMRFRKPQELKCNNISEPIDAIDFGPPCMQILPLNGLQLPSEDCLFLNIFTPTLNHSTKLPVCFWIYGGFYNLGSGSENIFITLSFSDIYDGSFYAIRDCVTVTFNYRLGVFGFLYANSSDAPGNQGIWDQAMALDWVIKNIGYFGGDPNNIMMFGESAGSISISLHIVSNITRNKFSKAIMQSGSGYGQLSSKSANEMYEISNRYASKSFLKCTEYNYVECLKNKTAHQLLFAQQTGIQWNKGAEHPDLVAYVFPFCSIYGDEFLPKSVNQAVKECDFNTNITVLIGHNELEGALFTLLNDIFFELQQRYNPFVQLYPYPFDNTNITYNDIIKFIGGFTAEAIAKSYTKQYNFLTFPNTNTVRGVDTNPLRISANHACGDNYITCPTVLFGCYLKKCSSFAGNVWQYRLTYANSQSLFGRSIWARASHLDDIPLVWGQPFKQIEGYTFNDSDRKISQVIMDIWAYFAHNGKTPIVNGHFWPEYSLKSNGRCNATYLVLHPDDDQLGTVFTNQYNAYDNQYNSSAINNCYAMDKLISSEFEQF